MGMMRGHIERRWDIFGQLAETQNVVIGLLVSKIYPDKKIGNLFNRAAEKGNLWRKVYSSRNRGWWGSDGVIQPNSCFRIFHPWGLTSFLWSSISMYQENYILSNMFWTINGMTQNHRKVVYYGTGRGSKSGLGNPVGFTTYGAVH